jgi:hypothetical protein
VFVLDRELAVRYRGRIDDQYAPGVARPQPTREDLRVALEELLSNQPVSQASAEPVGCLIGRVKPARTASKVTFCKEVARILQRHCVECHRLGEIGPFPLTDYDEVVGWADTMLEVLEQGRMPPWHARGDHAEFVNAREMPVADLETLREWVAAGTPFGDSTDLPPPASFADGWRLPREPDRVLRMRSRPYVVAASGTIEYQYFVVDPRLDEDKWVVASQINPGNRAVVHHCIVFIRPPDGTPFRGVGWLTGCVPGQRRVTLPPGRARRIPAGSKLVFQMHYTPTGTEQEDLTEMGLVFAKDEEVRNGARIRPALT